jgi:cysteine sulfinate desulfinase/cysteine desulfurase-like protein
MVDLREGQADLQQGQVELRRSVVDIVATISGLGKIAQITSARMDASIARIEEMQAEVRGLQTQMNRILNERDQNRLTGVSFYSL